MSHNNEQHVAQYDIGAMLSQRRQQENKSISEVSATIKLSPKIIEKLEANQFADVGTPVYVRGYLVLYAKYLKLDAPHLMEQYDIQYPAEEICIKPSADQTMGGPNRKRKRHSKWLSLLVTLGVVGGLVYGYTRLEPLFISSKSDIQLPLTAEQPKPQDSISLAIDQAEQAETLANDVLSGDALPNSTSLVTDIELSTTLAGNDASPVSQSAPTAISSDTEANTLNTPVDSENTMATPAVETETITNQTIQLESTPAEHSKPVKVTLAFSLSARCWVEVKDANGRVLTSRTYDKGKMLSFSGDNKLTMQLGNNRAVRDLLVNNKQVSLSQYKTGTRSYTITK